MYFTNERFLLKAKQYEKFKELLYNAFSLWKDA